MAKGLIISGQPLAAYAWRPLMAILGGGRGLCALLSASWGSSSPSSRAIVVAGMAARPTQLHVLLPFGAGVAAFSALLFVKGLGLPLKLWPW